MSDLRQLLELSRTQRGNRVALRWRNREWTWKQVGEEAEKAAGALRAQRVEPGDRVAIWMPNSAETVFAHLGAMIAGAVRVPVNAQYTEREAAHLIETTRPKAVVRAGLSGERWGGVAVKPDDVTLLCFTSGTTSRPKGVPLTHANLVHNIRGLVEAWEWTDRDTLLLCLPLMHLHGLGNGLNGWLATGCTMALEPKFDAPKTLAAIRESRATMFFGVPAMYARMLDVGEPLPDLRVWVTGSAPLDRTLEERWNASAGKPLVNRYGMTETVMITANPARSPRAGSVGRPLAGTEVRVDGKGEILVRGPSVFGGYWGGETDVTAFREDGWFATGDLGRFDDEGYLYITGRAKDIIICGGTNIAPIEIEEVLAAHPGVKECVVVAAPDPAMGEVPAALVVGEVTADALAEWCEGRLAKFKRPRVVKVVPGPLPRNAMQKLDRNAAKRLLG